MFSSFIISQALLSHKDIVCPDVSRFVEQLQLHISVKLSDMKLAFCVSDHVSECHETREGLDYWGMKTINES